VGKVESRIQIWTVDTSNKFTSVKFSIYQNCFYFLHIYIGFYSLISQNNKLSFTET